jgi:hypothetical protein
MSDGKGGPSIEILTPGGRWNTSSGPFFGTPVVGLVYRGLLSATDSETVPIILTGHLLARPLLVEHVTDTLAETFVGKMLLFCNAM